MPSQLRRRLNRFFDQGIAADIMALENTPQTFVAGPAPAPDPTKPNRPLENIHRHWPPGTFGDPIASVKSVVIHETSGWPSYASSLRFRDLFRTVNYLSWSAHLNRWQDRSGIGTQYFVEPNGTAYALIGAPDFAGDARVTWHGESMNRISVGIETADAGDAGIAPGANANGPYWFPLSNQPQDLPGRKLYLLLHPRHSQDVNLIWFAQTRPANAQLPRYDEPGDLANVAGWDRMIFTEREYRTLALLCRVLAERYGLPRNFLVLPYLDRDDDRNNAAQFRRMILGEQLREEIARKLGTTLPVIQAGGPPYTAWYGQQTARKWSRFFGADPQNLARADVPCFKGFLSHAVNGGHNCPGPFFDWHRLAREVWDWWWHPFDLDAAGAASAAQRPYRRARRDTRLVDHFWDAPGTAAQREALRLPQSILETFRLPAATPIHAMANGVIVAARLSVADPATDGFLLVRHELFHQGVDGRIDYDLAPTYVWTLTHPLQNAGFSIPAAPPEQAGALPATNPDWLNRFIVRLRECELAVEYHRTRQNDQALRRGWNRAPTGAGPRLATGPEIERDAAAYRAIAGDLSAGRVALFPRESQTDTTTVRVCLGDFLGFPGWIPVVDVHAARFEIFSRDRLPVPRAWQRPVSAAETNEPWWALVTAAARHEDTAAANLPAAGPMWQYPVPDFLQWVNNVTWASEWPKYDIGGAAPARPVSRA